jgi:hypothetical protein
MTNPFFDKPILNSPYEVPSRHWELDDTGRPTQRIVETRRRADFITAIAKPRKQPSHRRPSRRHCSSMAVRASPLVAIVAAALEAGRWNRASLQ